MSSKIVPGPYNPEERAYNTRCSSTFQVESWNLRTKKIESAQISPLLTLTDLALGDLRKHILEFVDVFSKNMWTDEKKEEGIYLESDSFRFLRSDRLDQNGHMYYTGQGYMPAIVVQIKIGEVWHDLKITFVVESSECQETKD